ncbi:hypothetical protein AAVH_18054 [Aphelenchoides avenae]|nr:hypothetical protein AAVH_18054 [Aphelenchus avenae]
MARSHVRRYFLRRVPRLNMFNAKRNEPESPPISGLDTALEENDVEQEVELEFPEWDTRPPAQVQLKPSFGFLRQFVRK